MVSAIGGNAGQLMKQIVYRYTLDGRVIRRTTIPFRRVCSEGAPPVIRYRSTSGLAILNTARPTSMASGEP